MYNPNIIAEKIKEAAKDSGVTVKAMLADTGLGVNTLQHMKTSIPKVDTLCKIADYLDVSVDFLLGRERNNAPENDLRSVIIERIKGMSDDQLKKLLDLLELLFSESEAE